MNKNNDWFIIKDLSEFIDASRKIVFNNFGKSTDVDNQNNIDNMIDDLTKEDQEELDKVLSLKEASSITKSFLKKQKNKRDNSIRYLVNESSYFNIIEALNNRLVSNILNSLVNKGLIETSFDEKSNDFVFWVNNDDSKNKKTETD